MQTLRALIVDDEPLARQRLRRLLMAEPDIQILDECGSAAEAQAMMLHEQPDIVFLDIDMPEGDGFQTICGLDPERRPSVVFVTAHDQHALRAFDAGAVDYLTKPLSSMRLRDCIDRLRRTFAGRTSRGGRLLVEHGYRRVWLATDTIDVVNASGNYVEIVAGTHRYLSRMPLHALKRQLDARQFAQIHRSHLVRIDAINDIETLRDGSVMVRLRNGMQLRTGRAYGRELRSELAGRIGG